ncbi:MAG: ribonuclease E/G, partial [Lachnospiraceae bacterium]|nr:ribonuclease E/G [Lachnospiraceae bacterium]
MLKTMDKLIITKEMSLHIKENRPFRLAFPSDGEPSVGDVYRARVQRVNPALKNAFLELGDGKRAYMNLGEGTLRPGQELTVMISQEGMKEKLPTAARELTFPGEWLVLTSDPGFLGFSRRASFDGPAREEIHTALSPWFETCGFILRTASEQATLDQLTQEAALLAEAFGNLLRRAEHSPAPCCLLKGSPVYLEWLQGLDKRELQVITD